MPGPAEDAAIRQQVEQALKKMTLYMAVGLVVLVILAVVASSLRGVFILAAIVYLCVGGVITRLLGRTYR